MKYRREYDLKVIGANLKRLRKKKSLSVKEVQEYLRLSSVQAIYKYENGKGYPQTDTMFALMELYEADLNDIINKHDLTLSECNLDYDILNICDYSRNQLNRLKGYLRLYKGIAS